MISLNLYTFYRQNNGIVNDEKFNHLNLNSFYLLLYSLNLFKD